MKKRVWTAIIAVSLAATCFLSACSKNKTEETEYETVKNTTDLDYKPADTTSVLTKDGQSDYKIVINDEDNRRGDLQFASSELQNFIKQSTGAILPIVHDTGLTFSEESKYIVLGENDVSKESGMSLDYEEYGEDGSYIKTVGNSVFINSVLYPGAMYGMYEFLWYNFGVRIYGYNEIKIPDHTQDTVYLKDFDYKNIPDFAERANSIDYRYDATTAFRLGFNLGQGENWYRWCHTHFSIMPKSTYFAEHRDWYSHDATQLCLTNDEMIEEFIKNMKKIITESPERREVPGYFELGHEDTNSFCECERCKQVASENGGNSGVMMLFMNKIADAMNPWMEETYPETSIKWVTFAYAKTVDAPARKKADGTYEAWNDDVKPHKNVGVMLAPLDSDWAHDLTDPEYNERWAAAIEGWKALDPEIFVYSYSVVFDDLFLFMDNWDTCKKQYQIWLDANAVFMFEEGGQTNMPFYELKNYVRIKMMWDVDADVEYYLNDFIDNYYKAAAPYVKEYLHRLRTNYQMIERNLAEKGEKFYLKSFVRYEPAMKSKEYWPMDWLLSGIQLYDEALKACEAMPEGKDKENAIKRVKAERASPIYILMSIYGPELSYGDIRYYIEEFREACEINEITQYGHKADKSIQSLLGDWMAYIE